MKLFLTLEEIAKLHRIILKILEVSFSQANSS